MEYDIDGTIRRNQVEIMEKISQAAHRSGRGPQEIRLLAVTKTFPRDVVEAAIKAGLRLFGENRVQEAAEKYQGREADVELHLIGHLQRNKAHIASRLFTCVQSIDKLETALALDRYVREQGRGMDILLEVNTSGESSKFGFQEADDLHRALDEILKKTSLNVRGLMTVGPLSDDMDRVHRSFASLREMFRQLCRRYPDLTLDTLSMGMSGDFPIAIEEGSTMVRIGTALFGSRSSGHQPPNH